MLELLKILPPFNLIESIFVNNPVELSITKEFYDIIQNIQSNKSLADSHTINDLFIMISAIEDHLWEILNTGHFSKVNKTHRQMYALMSLQKAILILVKNHIGIIESNEANEKCIRELDNGLLLGYPIDHPIYCNLLNDCLTLVQKQSNFSIDSNDDKLIKTDIQHDEYLNEKCDIDMLVQPSIQQFKQLHFDKCKPVLLKECISQWPALLKWPNPNYLPNICRNRTVPIEIGKNYTNEDWSQDLVKFDEFFHRQFIEQSDDVSSKKIEYLAQHNLFDQIAELKNDIIIPEYCCVTDDVNKSDHSIDVDIKAWFGPKGTISPMHFDEKHNLLCQVFGSKRILLAAPNDSNNLYPFEGDMLKNTSQIDAEHVDYERFPLIKNVKFYSMVLNAGEMLYIPSKWWHYVRSLSKSFSVSFWWE